MFEQKRIKEAEDGVREYLQEGKLFRLKIIDNNILETYRKNAEESLKTADFLFRNAMPPLWVVVCSYYSMFYVASAVLYSLGYKSGEKTPHKITADALVVFVRGKLKNRLIEDYEDAMGEALDLAGTKADELVFAFDQERKKRSAFQYEMTESVKRGKAQTSLDRAKSFVFELDKLVKP